MQNAINRPSHPGVAKKPSDIAKISKEAAAPKEKRPPTGYQLFCNHNREVAKLELQDTKMELETKAKESKEQLKDATEIPSITKILSRMWAETDEASKKVWTDKAKPAQDAFKLRKKEREEKQAQGPKAKTKTVPNTAGWQPSASELALLSGYSSMGAPLLMSGYSGPSLFSSAPPSIVAGGNHAGPSLFSSPLPAMGAGDGAPLLILLEMAVPPLAPAAYFPIGNLLDWHNDFDQGEPGFF